MSNTPLIPHIPILSHNNHQSSLLPDPSKIISDPTKLTPDPSKILLDTTNLLTEPSNILPDSTKLIPNPSEVLSDTTNLLTEPSKILTDTTKLLTKPISTGPSKIVSSTNLFTGEKRGADRWTRGAYRWQLAIFSLNGVWRRTMAKVEEKNGSEAEEMAERFYLVGDEMMRTELI